MRKAIKQELHKPGITELPAILVQHRLFAVTMMESEYILDNTLSSSI